MKPTQWWLEASLIAAVLGCTGASGQLQGVSNFGRPPGMPIGTGGSRGIDAGLAPVESDGLAPAPEASAGLVIPKVEASVAASTVPCGQCVELSVYVRDINQRDEFAFDAGGKRISRVVWTLMVTFNSDQLSVQPFVNDVRGTYTALHVNRFPLRASVAVTQDFSGKADRVGLVIGSSGAWTGDQIMSVFVEKVALEGPEPLLLDFEHGPEGIGARSSNHRPGVAYHPGG